MSLHVILEGTAGKRCRVEVDLVDGASTIWLDDEAVATAWWCGGDQWSHVQPKSAAMVAILEQASAFLAELGVAPADVHPDCEDERCDVG